jgi:hypothetical protein
VSDETYNDEPHDNENHSPVVCATGNYSSSDIDQQLQAGQCPTTMRP